MSRRLEELFRNQSGKFLSFIKRRIDDADEAEDILQELFARAAENLNSLAPIENLTAWMWAAARNRVVDYYRLRGRRREHEGEYPGAETVLNPEDLLTSPLPGVEQEFLRRELTDALYESLDELPAKQREVFLLQAVEGKTFKEISGLTGESINTLTARKRYAVRFLNRRMAEMKELLAEIQGS